MQFIILLFFINVLFAGEHSQKDLTFEFLYGSNEIFIDQDSVASFSGSIINISSNAINLAIVRRLDVNLENWVSSICIGSICYSDWVDSVTVNIPSGDTAAVGVLVWTNGEGKDTVKLDFFDLDQLDENVLLDLVIMSENQMSLFSENKYFPETISLKTFPNPFNSSFNIEYDLEIMSNISINIYDLNGRFIENIFEGIQGPGINKINWNFESNKNVIKSSGFYLCRIVLENKSFSSNILYVK